MGNCQKISVNIISTYLIRQNVGEMRVFLVDPGSCAPLRSIYRIKIIFSKFLLATFVIKTFFPKLYDERITRYRRSSSLSRHPVQYFFLNCLAIYQVRLCALRLSVIATVQLLKFAIVFATVLVTVITTVIFLLLLYHLIFFCIYI